MRLGSRWQKGQGLAAVSFMRGLGLLSEIGAARQQAMLRAGAHLCDPADSGPPEVRRVVMLFFFWPSLPHADGAPPHQPGLAWGRPAPGISGVCVSATLRAASSCKRRLSAHSRAGFRYVVALRHKKQRAGPPGTETGALPACDAFHNNPRRAFPLKHQWSFKT